MEKQIKTKKITKYCLPAIIIILILFAAFTLVKNTSAATTNYIGPAPTKRCCFNSCTPDGTCAQRCGDIPVSATCPSSRCTSNSQCTIATATKYCSFNSCTPDGTCIKRSGYIPVSEICPSNRCTSNSQCTSATKRCCFNSCTPYGTCAQRCGDIPVSVACPPSRCTSNSQCTPQFTCMYCCSSSKTCESYESERPCGPECASSLECKETSGNYTYFKCSGNKCVKAFSNYSVPYECRRDENCVGDYHNACQATPYRYLTVDSQGNTIIEIGITYNCRQLYYPGTNECNSNFDCCPGGNCGSPNIVIIPPGEDIPPIDDIPPIIPPNGDNGDNGDNVDPPSLPAPKCQIFEFSINGKTNEDRDPLFVLVNASLKGYISVNDSCKECTVTSDDTWGKPSEDYTITSIADTYINRTFSIPESGIYSFSLSCIGNPADPDDFDEDTTSLKAVEALNLPWWREIIPVLQGFLRGAWE